MYPVRAGIIFLQCCTGGSKVTLVDSVSFNPDQDGYKKKCVGVWLEVMTPW
jgi:hypothetical protein